MKQTQQAFRFDEKKLKISENSEKMREKAVEILERNTDSLHKLICGLSGSLSKDMSERIMTEIERAHDMLSEILFAKENRHEKQCSSQSETLNAQKVQKNFAEAAGGRSSQQKHISKTNASPQGTRGEGEAIPLKGASARDTEEPTFYSAVSAGAAPPKKIKKEQKGDCVCRQLLPPPA